MTAYDVREAIEQAIARGLTITQICIQLKVHPNTVDAVWNEMDRLNHQQDTA